MLGAGTQNQQLTRNNAVHFFAFAGPQLLEVGFNPLPTSAFLWFSWVEHWQVTVENFPPGHWGKDNFQ